MTRFAAGISCVPTEARVLLSCLVLAVLTIGIAAPIIAAATPIPNEVEARIVKKDQERFVQRELEPVPVLYTRDDPWIIKQVPTISDTKGNYEKATKPKKRKRSDVTDDVIRNASRAALMSYAKADIGKGAPQLGLPRSLWCMDFVNRVLRRVGLPTTNSRMARSPLSHPKFEKVAKPAPGDIVVIARGRNTTYGHVALYNGSCGKGGIRMLGGNQRGGRVTNDCIHRARVVGYVRPKTIPEIVIARLLT